MTVVVVGAGAAGLAAAISSAAAGAEVVFLERRGEIGGTVTGSLIHTLGGLYDADGKPANPGLPAELERRLLAAGARPRKIGRLWTLTVDPPLYGGVVKRWIGEMSRIRYWPGSRPIRLEQRGRTIHSLEFSQRGRVHRADVDAVIDTTGTAEVVRLLGPGYVRDTERRALGGFIFSLRGTAPGVLDFPRGIEILRRMRSAAERGELPPECAGLWLDLGFYDDEIYAKLSVSLPSDWRDGRVYRRLVQGARKVRQAIVVYLGRQESFRSVRVGLVGRLGIREGGRVLGEYTLTLDDVKSGRRFPDAACRATWPIEYWDPEKGVSLEPLGPTGDYEIPLRCLRVQGFDNFWVAGKCFSAEERAQASARVVGTCWAMGEAVGKAVVQ